MDINKELRSKIKSLEEENRALRRILGDTITSDHGNIYRDSNLSGAAARNISGNASEKDLHIEQSLNNRESTSNERYISTLSRKLNSLTDERGVLKTVLQDLSAKSGSKYIYYIQLDGSSCIISSIVNTGGEPGEEIFSFQEYSSSRSELHVDLDDLYAIGSMIIEKSHSPMFYSKCLWMSSDVESAILIPVIVQNEIIGVIVIDITGNEKSVSPYDIMFYQTVSSIVTGSLKRIAYENMIRDRKDRYELIIENTTHLLFQTLPDGTLTFANRSFAGFFGLTPADLNGRELSSVTGTEPGFILSLISRLNGASSPVDFETSITNHNGNRRILKLSINPVSSENGNLLLVNFLGEDITEKKLLEDELIATKRRLDLAFLASNDAYWDANLITGEFFYSQNFYRMLEYDSSDMPSIFRDFLKLVHPEDIILIKGILKKCYEGEIIRTSLRFRAITSGGDYKWIYSRLMIIETSENGTPSRIIGTNVDLTATVKIEEKLKESETRLKMILDNMPVMLDAVDETGMIIHWNRECEHVTGYSGEEIINNPDAGSILYPDSFDRKSFYNMLIEHRGNYRNFESTLTSKRGVRKTILWSNLSDLYPVAGWHSWAVGIDITQLREAREALKESSYKLMEAQSIARLGYWEYYHDRKEFVWDSTLAGLIGFPDRTMIIPEREMLNYIHEDDRERVAGSFLTCIKDMRIHNDIIRYITKNGETIHIKQASKTDYSDSGKPIVTRGVCLDVTELKKTEIELLKAKEKAEESNRLKSAFLANMSHEARTPLNSIMGFSELLSDRDISSEDKITYTEIIRESSRQLTSLISDIIDISKIDTNLMVINKKPAHLNRIIDHIYEVFRKEIRGKTVEIYSFKALDDNSDAIVTDETRLQQILNNLIVNALKFTEAGSVSFGYRITEDGKFLEFHVSDTGIGIAKNKQKMIFGRFKQADSTIGRKYGGTGLGLSISRELCRLLGGKIWVRSELKKGSTFYFKIPYETATAVDPAGETSGVRLSEKTDLLRNRTILITDDNRAVHKLLSAIFKKYGAQTLSAETAAEAMDILHTSTVDIALLDIQMPDIDGTVLLHMIREINSSIPVVAQTANALEDDRRRYLDLGFDAYISKPFNREELILTVSSLINNPKTKPEQDR